MGRNLLRTAFVAIGWYVLRFPALLLEDWLMGEIIGGLEANYQTILSVILTWVLPLLVAIGLVYVGYKLKSKSTAITSARGDEIIRTSLEGRIAEPSVMVNVSSSRLIELENKVLIEVSIMLHATLPAQLNSIRLEVLGKFLDESTDRWAGFDITVATSGNTWFNKPNKAKGKQKARIWVNAVDENWLSNEFTIDFDQQPELRK